MLNHCLWSRSVTGLCSLPTVPRDEENNEQCFCQQNQVERPDLGSAGWIWRGEQTCWRARAHKSCPQWTAKAQLINATQMEPVTGFKEFVESLYNAYKTQLKYIEGKTFKKVVHLYLSTWEMKFLPLPVQPCILKTRGLLGDGFLDKYFWLISQLCFHLHHPVAEPCMTPDSAYHQILSNVLTHQIFREQILQPIKNILHGIGIFQHSQDQ